MDIWNKIQSTPVILGIVIVVLSQIAAFGFRWKAEKEGYQLMAPLDSISMSQSNLNIKDYNLTQIELNRISELNKIILKHKEQHKLTFLTLYQFHFASISLLTIFSILSGILAFIVAQKGWKDTSDVTRTLFLTCTALTSFYALSINVYKQDIGINKNLKSYLQYDNVQKEILNFCSTNPHQTISGDTISFNRFYSSSVKRLIEINNISLEFDKDAIELKDYLNQN